MSNIEEVVILNKKERVRMYKKFLSYVFIITVVLSSSIPVSASETYLPYTEMDYNLNIVTKEDWENTNIGEYPINIHSEEWSQLSSSELAAACDMPSEYAVSLGTDELVDYAVNYPFLMDILAYDNIEDGINHLVNRSSVFEELFSRTDCYDELIAEYLEMDINYIEVAASHDMCETNYDAELFIEAYIGLNYDLLTVEQTEIFVEEYGNKFFNMNSECQDSALSTIFYDAIEEKIEVIPESAVPESVAGKLLDSSDVCGTSRASVYCEQCGATMSSTSIVVNGRTIYCYQWLSGGLTTNDIANLDSYIANYYPSYTKVASASSKYNCHSYAWYSTATSNNYWINSPFLIYSNTAYWQLWTVPMRTLQADDRITFWSDSTLLHSAIVNSSTTCTSKLGHYGVYRTTISEMNSFYGASTTEAYIPRY